jgi:hypothetical protein
MAVRSNNNSRGVQEKKNTNLVCEMLQCRSITLRITARLHRISKKGKSAAAQPGLNPTYRQTTPNTWPPPASSGGSTWNRSELHGPSLIHWSSQSPNTEFPVPHPYHCPSSDCSLNNPSNHCATFTSSSLSSCSYMQPKYF